MRSLSSEFKIAGLTTNQNIDLLEKQIKEFRPKAAAVMDEEKADLLKDKVDVNVYAGIKGVIKIAKLSQSDTVVNSLVGTIGILPTYEAIRAKKSIALANKEALVAAGSIIINLAKKKKVSVMPIDSEHSAIFQCLNGEDIKNVNKIVITCSGGAFRDYAKWRLSSVKAEDALKHPTWNMGAKITIDSATLMNKGFEVIEAHWLYGLEYERIQIVIHPQSVIHSMVEFIDRSVIAQMGVPDMKMPIQYALTYPKRMKNDILPKLNLTEKKELTFKTPDFEAFPCLKYAYEAGKAGGSLPCVMNAANDEAVSAFLKNRIKFTSVHTIIRKMMDEHDVIKNPDLDDILEAERSTKEKVKKLIAK